MKTNINKFLQRNQSTILTCISIGGFVATTILTARAASKSTLKIHELEKEVEEPLSTKEKIIAAAPEYVAPVVIGMATVGCMIYTNMLTKKQQVALISAYAVLNESYKRHKKAIKDRFGDGELEDIAAECADEVYEEKKPVVTDGKTLFYDEISKSFFESTMFDVTDAVYHFNRNFVLRGYASLNELYEFLNLPRQPYGNSLGWSIDIGECFYGYSWIDFSYLLRTRDDGVEYYILHMPFVPTADYMGNPEDVL